MGATNASRFFLWFATNGLGFSRSCGRLLDLVVVRIVSLLPSATEIVYGLGLGSQLAGVTFECDEPASARTEKTVVVGGRDTAAMTPAAIDAYVRAQP